MNIANRLQLALASIMNKLGSALVLRSRALGGDAIGGYDVIPRNQYDCLPKDTCVFGAIDKFLLVPKNRYKTVLLPGQTANSNLGVGWITEDNSVAAYDQLWGDEGNLEAFRTEADGIREKLTTEIVDCIETGIPDSADVVDIGCGVGDLLAEVRQRKPGVEVSGLDFSQKAVDAAATTFPNSKFMQFVIDRILPYETAGFDVVMCTDVLEHLDHPKVIAMELIRICRPGGLVVIVVPDGDIDQFLGHYWFWNEESLYAMLAEWNPDVTRLPETGEFIAKISIPTKGDGK